MTQDYDIGGAELQLERVARLLAGWLGTCDVITTRPLGEAARTAGVHRHRVGAQRKHALWRVINLWAGFRYFAWHGGDYDVIHGFCLSALVIGALLGGKMRRCRTVLRVCTVGLRGDVAKVKSRRLGGLVWWLVRRADAFAALTPGMAAALQRDGVPAAKVTVLPSAIPIDTAEAALPAARAVARATLQLPERPTVLCVGRWVTQKRVHILLQAWEILASTEAMLLLVGDGPERPRIEHWASHAGCAASVRLYGWQLHPERFYRAADIFVFTAREEVFGNVVAEAMAHGLAVITTRTGLAPHWIEDGVNGIFVNDDAPAELAETLAALLRDAPRRARLGSAARRTASAAFRPEVVLDRQLALYAGLLRAGAAARPVA